MVRQYGESIVISEVATLLKNINWVDDLGVNVGNRATNTYSQKYIGIVGTFTPINILYL